MFSGQQSSTRLVLLFLNTTLQFPDALLKIVSADDLYVHRQLTQFTEIKHLEIGSKGMQRRAANFQSFSKLFQLTILMV